MAAAKAAQAGRRPAVSGVVGLILALQLSPPLDEFGQRPLIANIIGVAVLRVHLLHLLLARLVLDSECHTIASGITQLLQPSFMPQVGDVAPCSCGLV